MIVDGATLESESELNYDICVVGAGPAGLSFVNEFLDQNLRPSAPRVALLESGPSEATDYPNDAAVPDMRRWYADLKSAQQNSYEGTLSGWLQTSKPDYLTESRLRAYGGTGNVWSGWWCSLEPTDLVRGDWPIEYEEIDHFGRRACVLYSLPPAACLWSARDEMTIPVPASGPRKNDSTGLVVRPLLAKRVNIGQLFRDRLRRSRNVDLILNANVAALHSGAGSVGKTRVRNLTVLAENGDGGLKPFHLCASIYVLAAGSIETTRLLLSSGVGAWNTLLGRYFQEHLYIWNAGSFAVSVPDTELEAWYFPPRLRKGRSAGAGVLAMLTPTPQYLDEQGCNSFRVLLGGAPGIPGTVNLCCEQEPQAESRLELGDSPDRFGLRRVRVESELGEKDQRTAAAALKAVRQFLISTGLGTDFRFPELGGHPSDRPPEHRLAPGNHPSGSTRMSQDPMRGVVDPNCKVHGVENLYVSSASVFPSGGYANPTLTIVALALRLAEHLKGKGAGWTSA